MDYATLASPEIIETTITNLRERGVDAQVVDSGAAALTQIKTLIPTGASVMNGASVTLEQIGFIDLLKSGEHGWNNLHAAIVAEKDPAKQAQLRKQALLSEYYLGSVHALSQTGEFLVASNTGSQLPHVVFSSPNLIFVVGAQKIVPAMTDMLNRLNEYVVPLEDKHMQELYGAHTSPSKIVIFNRENKQVSTRTVRMLIVREKLGF